MYLILAFLYLIHTTTCQYDRRTITTLRFSKYSIIPTVVNGKPAVRGQVPYMVSIKEGAYKRNGLATWENICGGSIIDSIKVLSAAHCFESNDFYYEKHPEDLRVVAGDLRNDIVHSGDTETTESTQWRGIIKVVLHKEYNFPNNDIALAYVNEPWEFNNIVDFIPLAEKHLDYSTTCASAGYGRIGPSLQDTISPVLLKAKIDVMSRWRCSLWWEMNMNDFVCTNSAVTDVSRGDSGGPLACYGTGDPNEVSGKELLVGVVSGKNFDKTTLYTRVSAFHDWIERGASSKLSVQFYLLIIVLILIYLLFDCLIQ